MLADIFLRTLSSETRLQGKFCMAMMHATCVAEEQLRIAERQPGFVPALLQLVQDKNAPVIVRFSAAIYFKNTIKMHWKWVNSVLGF